MYEKLKEIRTQKGYSIEEMADIIDKSPCTYFKKENGDVKFSVNEAIAISKFLHKKSYVFSNTELGLSFHISLNG